ncbi:hypothetical protein TBLA_0J01220 [Henningerozyma blattae CBS 6284]|uniref:Uncharacterized protein n=1 Tax=Henningerozyma blattae (strain ATCC 34711 / CBS 6284 / DSM 70876 / NBRC 10599 / NRRL Y-10934 / UCD 77-7) TaxID=1071380 RepID=I2H9R7_HENB6|nr:hypothetical protein TBLA_0J01220 [Tetrapisispora blattae CBS 6284]CCH63119.1 hypothetical protein TBLA_0J01220 [Tetrapisispora blattae CBS 6284]
MVHHPIPSYYRGSHNNNNSNGNANELNSNGTNTMDNSLMNITSRKRYHYSNPNLNHSINNKSKNNLFQRIGNQSIPTSSANSIPITNGNHTPVPSTKPTSRYGPNSRPTTSHNNNLHSNINNNTKISNNINNTMAPITTGTSRYKSVENDTPFSAGADHYSRYSGNSTSSTNINTIHPTSSRYNKSFTRPRSVDNNISGMISGNIPPSSSLDSLNYYKSSNSSMISNNRYRHRNNNSPRPYWKPNFKNNNNNNTLSSNNTNNNNNNNPKYSNNQISTDYDNYSSNHSQASPINNPNLINPFLTNKNKPSSTTHLQKNKTPSNTSLHNNVIHSNGINNSIISPIKRPYSTDDISLNTTAPNVTTSANSSSSSNSTVTTPISKSNNTIELNEPLKNESQISEPPKSASITTEQSLKEDTKVETPQPKTDIKVDETEKDDINEMQIINNPDKVSSSENAIEDKASISPLNTDTTDLDPKFLWAQCPQPTENKDIKHTDDNNEDEDGDIEMGEETEDTKAGQDIIVKKDESSKKLIDINKNPSKSSSDYEYLTDYKLLEMDIPKLQKYIDTPTPYPPPIREISSCIFPMNEIETKLWYLKNLKNDIQIINEKYLPKTSKLTINSLSEYSFFNKNIMKFNNTLKYILLRKNLKLNKKLYSLNLKLKYQYLNELNKNWNDNNQVLKDLSDKLRKDELDSVQKSKQRNSSSRKSKSDHKDRDNKREDSNDSLHNSTTNNDNDNNSNEMETNNSSSSISLTRRRNRADFVDDEDIENVLLQIDPDYKHQQLAAKIPDLIQNPIKRFRLRFQDVNNLVTNKNKWASRILTDGVDNFTDLEHQVFLEAYLNHPKKFGKISNLMNFKRSPEDCVLHYYKTKKEVNYKQLIIEKNKKRKNIANAKRKIKKKEKSNNSVVSNNNANTSVNDISNSSIDVINQSLELEPSNTPITSTIVADPVVPIVPVTEAISQPTISPSISANAITPPTIEYASYNDRHFVSSASQKSPNDVITQRTICNDTPIAATDTHIEPIPITNGTITPIINKTPDTNTSHQDITSNIPAKSKTPELPTQESVVKNDVTSIPNMTNNLTNVNTTSDTSVTSPQIAISENSGNESNFTGKRIRDLLDNSITTTPTPITTPVMPQVASFTNSANSSNPLTNSPKNLTTSSPSMGDNQYARKRNKHNPDHKSSYWSVKETNMFPELLKKFGSDWSLISSALNTKSATMVKNYYQRNCNQLGWKQIVGKADQIKKLHSTHSQEAISGNSEADDTTSGTTNVPFSSPTQQHMNINAAVQSYPVQPVGQITSQSPVTAINSMHVPQQPLSIPSQQQPTVGYFLNRNPATSPLENSTNSLTPDSLSSKPFEPPATNQDLFSRISTLNTESAIPAPTSPSFQFGTKPVDNKKLTAQLPPQSQPHSLPQQQGYSNSSSTSASASPLVQHQTPSQYPQTSPSSGSTNLISSVPPASTVPKISNILKVQVAPPRINLHQDHMSNSITSLLNTDTESYYQPRLPSFFHQSTVRTTPDSSSTNAKPMSPISNGMNGNISPTVPIRSPYSTISRPDGSAITTANTNMIAPAASGPSHIILQEPQLPRKQNIKSNSISLLLNQESGNVLPLQSTRLSASQLPTSQISSNIRSECVNNVTSTTRMIPNLPNISTTSNLNKNMSINNTITNNNNGMLPLQNQIPRSTNDVNTINNSNVGTTNTSVSRPLSNVNEMQMNFSLDPLAALAAVASAPEGIDPTAANSPSTSTPRIQK